MMDSDTLINDLIFLPAQGFTAHRPIDAVSSLLITFLNFRLDVPQPQASNGLIPYLPTWRCSILDLLNDGRSCRCSLLDG